MKPIATVDGKSEMSTTEMGPVTIVQPEPSKKGLTSKHVLIAGTVVLAVLIVVAGFVAAAVLIQRTATHSTEQLAKMYTVKINDGKQTKQEDVRTNTKERTTEQTERDEKGAREHTVFHDFKRSVTLYMSYKAGESDSCYVSPLNKSSEMAPNVLQKYLEDHPNPEIEAKEDKERDRLLEPADDPIEDTDFLGQRINDMCRGRPIYWLFPEETRVDDDKMSTTVAPHSRQKRSFPYCPHPIRLVIRTRRPYGYSCYSHCCQRYIGYRRYHYPTGRYYIHWVGINCYRINDYHHYCPQQ